MKKYMALYSHKRGVTFIVISHRAKLKSYKKKKKAYKIRKVIIVMSEKCFVFFLLLKPSLII